MARRRRTGAAEDIIDLTALLPWWAGVALAVVLYVVLHRLSAPVPTAGVQPGQIGGFMARTMVATLASIGQYLLPLLCLIGAAASYWKRRQRSALVAAVPPTYTAQMLDGMSWQAFEMLVGEAYRLQGYAVQETGGGGADGGIDLLLAKDGEKFLVQCKHWKAYKVGVSVVRELFGLMAAKGAAGGFVVTSGRFTQEAKDFAAGRNIRLVDGEALFALIQSVRKTGAVPAAASQDVPLPAADTPGCPLCGEAMVKRTAKRGNNAGQVFWGCSGFPGCRAVRQVEG